MKNEFCYAFFTVKQNIDTMKERKSVFNENTKKSSNEEMDRILIRWRLWSNICELKFTCAYKQSIAQPWLEESIFYRLIEINLTAQNQFNITGIQKEDKKSRPNPHLDDILEAISPFQESFEDDYKSKTWEYTER